MPKPQKTENENTTISIPKTLKANLRLYALPHTKRKGNESDAQVLTRILNDYISEHPPVNTSPISTY